MKHFNQFSTMSYKTGASLHKSAEHDPVLLILDCSKEESCVISIVFVLRGEMVEGEGKEHRRERERD